MARKRKLENEAVRREVTELRKAIDQLSLKFNKSGENVMNWFTMSDAKKEGFMEANQFKEVLANAGVRVTDHNLVRVFELVDLNNTGRIRYQEFIDVVKRNIQLPLS